MAVTDIAFTGIPVVDIERARDFYERVLGLRPLPDTANGMLIEYQVGQAVLTIGRLGDAFKPSSDGPFVALEVDDIDAEVEKLQANHIRFVIPMGELPTSRFSIILDPDGNKIMIHKRK